MMTADDDFAVARWRLDPSANQMQRDRRVCCHCRSETAVARAFEVKSRRTFRVIDSPLRLQIHATAKAPVDINTVHKKIGILLTTSNRRGTMKILMAGLAFMGWMSGNALAQAGPVEYVRVCDVYGAGFFYIPGTEQCLRPNTGEIRYETEDGTVRTETELAARVRALENRMADWEDFDNHIAISNALQSPDLVAGETFGVRLNWGAGASSHAFGLTGAVTFGEGFLDGGRGRLSGYSGVAFSGGKVGGSAGIQFSW